MKLKSLILLLLLQLVIIGCDKEENENYSKPEISTSEISEITNTTAICSGNLTSDGGKTITAKGVVWHTSANATIEVNTGIATVVNEVSEFVGNLTDLTANTKYFVCAFATNELGTVYGEEKEFTTTNYRKPEISTSEISEITNSTATCGGNITSDGGKTITTSGVVWHTSANATIERNTGKTTDGTLVDEFMSSLTDLNLNTKYFVRAYATNELGTVYGNEKSFTTTLAIEDMIFVEGGTFQMGSTSGWSDQSPVHSVTLSSFEIGKFEVTQALWKAVMDGANPSYNKGDNLPVENVSWFDVQIFLTNLNQLTGKIYRLPTEAEWEFASRGGNSSNGYTYAGSNTVWDVAWFSGNTISSHEIGGKQANELGIYDMSGNVEEWCSDWRGSSYYSISPTVNPQGPSSDPDYIRVLRGGSYQSSGNCKVAFRGGTYPTDKNSSIGFRLVRSL